MVEENFKIAAEKAMIEEPEGLKKPVFEGHQMTQCFICRKSIEVNPDYLCLLCASKQPVIYDL